MRDVTRREVIAGVIASAVGAEVLGYARRRYSTRNDLRFQPVELHNSNPEPQDVYLRIYDDDGFEYDERHTLDPGRERVGEDDSYTTKTLDGPWTETPREYALLAAHDTVVWDLSNADIRSKLADADPESDCADVSISVAGKTPGETSLAVFISASEAC